ncbi:TadE/TadG family type IV pilus assembly protein [Demequina sp. NBRC 110053]|uniref:TadE/TadG family type IV pilus assembly protein n=1 Tax=Demequina sp. NBRC 110053 TaxID=1570342 RepID=UPI000A063C14|nr:TadE/TadG family type IV pilus assembly protein [Demequina sp. NBRC 110053]
MRSSPSLDPERQRGSATVEFVLVGSLVVLLGLALVQLVLALHVRNTLTSSAYEGARTAAQADRGLADGEDRARSLARDALGGIAVDTDAWEASVDGAPVAVVELSAPAPVVGMWGPGTLRVEARAFEESGDG